MSWFWEFRKRMDSDKPPSNVVGRDSFYSPVVGHNLPSGSFHGENAGSDEHVRAPPWRAKGGPVNNEPSTTFGLSKNVRVYATKNIVKFIKQKRTPRAGVLDSRQKDS